MLLPSLRDYFVQCFHTEMEGCGPICFCLSSRQINGYLIYQVRVTFCGPRSGPTDSLSPSNEALVLFAAKAGGKKSISPKLPVLKYRQPPLCSQRSLLGATQDAAEQGAPPCVFSRKALCCKNPSLSRTVAACPPIEGEPEVGPHGILSIQHTDDAI